MKTRALSRGFAPYLEIKCTDGVVIIKDSSQITQLINNIQYIEWIYWIHMFANAQDTSIRNTTNELIKDQRIPINLESKSSNLVKFLNEWCASKRIPLGIYDDADFICFVWMYVNKNTKIFEEYAINRHPQVFAKLDDLALLKIH